MGTLVMCRQNLHNLLEETILDTMGNEVAVCLGTFDRVVVMVEVCLELCTRGCDARVRVRLVDDRKMDDPRPRELVRSISVVMKEP